MSKIIFNEKQIRMLEKNNNVKAVSTKSITYTDNFKNEFMTKLQKAIFPRNIFEEAGFDVEILGMKRVEQCAERWKRKYKTGEFLNDARKNSTGRPLKRDLSTEEIIARLKAKNMLLEAENELLKKAELIERGLIIKITD